MCYFFLERIKCAGSFISGEYKDFNKHILYRYRGEASPVDTPLGTGAYLNDELSRHMKVYTY